MTKFIKLEVSDVAEPIDESTLTELRKKMLAAVDEKIQDGGPRKQRAVEQVDKVLGALRMGGALNVSTTTIIDALTEIIEELHQLPHAVRSIAQNINRPSHIFDLGGAYAEMLMAMGLLTHAKESLEVSLTCEHCKTAEPETADPKVGQA